APRKIEQSLSSLTEATLTVAIPVTLDGASGGVEVRRRSGQFTEEDESLLASMAQMAAVALQNARLYQAIEVNEERLGALVEAAPLAIVDLDLRKQARI